MYTLKDSTTIMYIMYNIVPILLLLLFAPSNVYGIACWCQQGPSDYQTFVDSEQSWSDYTNCYLTGNNPSSDTCYDATCPGGDWVLGNDYSYGEIYISVTDGDDCISQCSVLGSGYNIANMDATCTNTNTNSGYYYDDDVDGLNDDNSLGSCNILICPQVWDGQCGAFNKPTDKWCDYDGTDANVCCASDFSECCEADGGVIGGTIAAVVIFLGFCFWYCRRRRDNTNDEPPNCAYKFFCPPCAVFGYQGCENKTDACMTCCCCWLFTLCCWEPKKVVVIDDNIHTNIPHIDAIEITTMDDKVQPV